MSRRRSARALTLQYGNAILPTIQIQRPERDATMARANPGPSLVIEFDPAKNAANKAKHGLDLGFAAHVLADPFAIDVLDLRRDYGETRFRAMGDVAGRVCVVVHTERKHLVRGRAGPIRTRRIISVRKANDRETRVYRNATAKP